jgi:hypothetical protein
MEDIQPVTLAVSPREYLSLSDFERHDHSSCAFSLSVSVRLFQCSVPRVWFEDLDAFICNLERALQTLSGTAILQSREKDKIQFTFDRLGHVVVSGDLFRLWGGESSVKFSLSLDQTFIGPFLRQLKHAWQHAQSG